MTAHDRGQKHTLELEFQTGVSQLTPGPLEEHHLLSIAEPYLQHSSTHFEGHVTFSVSVVWKQNDGSMHELCPVVTSKRGNGKKRSLPGVLVKWWPHSQRWLDREGREGEG